MKAMQVKNGVAPSYLWLQQGTWNSLLEFLIQRFPHISGEVWQRRMERGEVTDETGCALTPTSPYCYSGCGGRIFYYREVASETPVPFEEQILFQDQHILVIDKPHFLPVIPGGRFLHETLLVRLKNKYPLPHLTPIHRLDRETAGVMIFSLNPDSRGAYQTLFQQRAIQKEYEAIAPHLAMTPIIHRSRLEAGTPFFRMQEVAGESNSETQIECIERIGELSRYRLHPITGRKHQLRVHLAALGIPILNDLFYPIAQPCQADDFTKPLQLLSRSIAFTDPITQQKRYFESHLKLMTVADF